MCACIYVLTHIYVCTLCLLVSTMSKYSVTLVVVYVQYNCPRDVFAVIIALLHISLKSWFVCYFPYIVGLSRYFLIGKFIVIGCNGDEMRCLRVYHCVFDELSLWVKIVDIFWVIIEMLKCCWSLNLNNSFLNIV